MSVNYEDEWVNSGLCQLSLGSAPHLGGGKQRAKRWTSSQPEGLFSGLATYRNCYPLTEFRIHEIRIGLMGVQWHLLVLVAVTVWLPSVWMLEECDRGGCSGLHKHQCNFQCTWRKKNLISQHEIADNKTTLQEKIFLGWRLEGIVHPIIKYTCFSTILLRLHMVWLIQFCSYLQLRDGCLLSLELNGTCNDKLCIWKTWQQCVFFAEVTTC